MASTRSLIRVLGLALLVCCALALPAAAQLNLVYTNGNIPHAGMNAIYGYSNDGTGKLTPLPGSPYLTGGTGVGYGGGSDHQWDSDNELITNAAHTLLFAVNAGSNTIAVMNINADGSLTPITGSPFDSHGVDPASLALKENTLGPGIGTLVVVNKNSDPAQTNSQPPNYATFTVAADGTLTFNAGSVMNLPIGSSPAEVFPYPGTPVQFFGVEFLNFTVSNYSLKKSGVLTLNSQNTPPAPKSNTPAVLGAAFNGQPNKNYFYVDLPVEHVVAVYQYTSKGILTYLREVSNRGSAICWSTVNAKGNRLVVGETPSSTTTLYSLDHAGTPSQVQRVTLKAVSGGQGANANNTKPLYDPTGAFLYFLDRNGAIHVLNVNADDSVTENLNPTLLGTGTDTVPLGLVAFQK